MNEKTLRDLLKFDDQGLLSIEKIKYGIYHKGSFWTGGTPAQAIVNLFEQFPEFRITKELIVSELDIFGNGALIGTKYLAKPFIYSKNELKFLRATMRKKAKPSVNLI